MRMSRLFLTATTVLSLAAGAALADGHLKGAVKARQSLMTLNGFNLGQLGAMAKGAVPYDSEAASKAAANLLAISQMDQSAMWPMGSDNANFEGTRATPSIWANFGDVMGKLAAVNVAATAMSAAAGTDLASLQAAMGPLGGACGACHKAFRAAK